MGCRTFAECKEVGADELFFHIASDPQERNELDLLNLSDDQKAQYFELKEELEQWISVAFEHEMAVFNANGLPEFWSCYWYPWADSSLSYDVCLTVSGLEPIIDCGSQPANDDWLEYA